MEVTFGTGSIVYRETIEEPVEGMGHFEPCAITPRCICS